MQFGSGPGTKESSPGLGGCRAAERRKDELLVAGRFLRQTIFTSGRGCGQAAPARSSPLMRLNSQLRPVAERKRGAVTRVSQAWSRRLVQRVECELGAKKAPLGKSRLDPARSGKRRGEEPQSQENALRAKMRRAELRARTPVLSLIFWTDFNIGAGFVEPVGSIGYRDHELDGKPLETRRFAVPHSRLDKVNNPHV